MYFAYHVHFDRLMYMAYFGQLFVSFWDKKGETFYTWYVVDHDIVFCALDIWYVDHDHIVLYLWILDMVVLTHECILTIFGQVIFGDICGYLCVNLFKSCGSALDYVQVLLMFFLTFICRYCSTFGEVLSEWVALYESWVGITYLYLFVL